MDSQLLLVCIDMAIQITVFCFEACVDGNLAIHILVASPCSANSPIQVDEQLGFYETFAPVFRKNARWSTRFPVPELGDEKTEMTKVHKERACFRGCILRCVRRMRQGSVMNLACHSTSL